MSLNWLVYDFPFVKTPLSKTPSSSKSPVSILDAETDVIV
jgi:hypothetical protein